MRVVLASNNAKKLAELRALLGAGAAGAPGAAAELPVELVAQGSLGIAEAEEPHASFLENALAKARHAAAGWGGAAIADDSGLCVDALGGAPGVASAVYAGPVAPLADGDEPREALRARQDAANNALLLQRMAGHTAAGARRARFVCTLVALRHTADPEPLVATGRWEGTLLTAPAGQGGFGYDPLLFIPALGTSVAALDAATKNACSHRAQAAASLVALLRAHWRPGG